MSILQNALDSIAIGLEDFESADERRIISATRNIFAGVLLIFKHRLCELSPAGSDEALIKQRVLPTVDATGAVNWIGKGKKTVDVQNIKERFTSLDIFVDWERLKKINQYRNDIEHYYSVLNNASVQQLISNSFLIIRDFIADELGEDPKLLLGENYWKILVDVNEVYEKEKKECDFSLEKLQYFGDEILNALKAYQCDRCGSGLLETKSTGSATEALFECKACGKKYLYKEIVNGAVNEYYVGDVYLAQTDGGELPVVGCPFCFDETYIFSDSVCAVCGDSAVHECTNCGSGITPEEISDGDLCGYCAYRWEKIKAE